MSIPVDINHDSDMILQAPIDDLNTMISREKKLLQMIAEMHKSFRKLVDSEIVKNAPFISYSESYDNAKETLAKVESMMKEIGVEK